MSGMCILAADIDLGGESWEPLNFDGSLDGCGYTISNVTITQSVDGNTGFFGSGTAECFGGWETEILSRNEARLLLL